ncbi:putative methylated-DNA protein cysteine methyltransferase [Moumouvirus australiensis]|uniref:methylated-DNA--[protein]-cysteine S-methyltransferase n=1 Tax=Moumouvirus australiensis TaxID=2109587 RepID=A0A2P1EL10_9VIRU|nr:putative methylated-DNA protein cysteine methyltransferase [Moumouvirus australiensis]AVL94582.1 putative methylated-DNA protein cysteine methyltransferase [Moumouvirus australiensis]
MSLKEYLKTPLGIIKIKTFNKKLVEIKFIKSKKKYTNPNKPSEYYKYVKKLFSGKYVKNLDNLPMNGTEFQKKVWEEILSIPYGETRTYTDIAIAIGKPTAIRAVANACGKNNMAIIIPCHRVIGKKNIGGYKWGLEKKIWLIELEKK